MLLADYAQSHPPIGERVTEELVLVAVNQCIRDARRKLREQGKLPPAPPRFARGQFPMPGASFGTVDMLANQSLQNKKMAADRSADDYTVGLGNGVQEERQLLMPLKQGELTHTEPLNDNQQSLSSIAE